MKTLPRLSILIALLFFCALTIRGQTTHPMNPLVAGNNAFAFDLYGQLRAKDGNLFLSPYSISTCLAMARAGARGETEKQMDQALHFPPGPSALHTNFAQLQRELNELPKKDNQLQFNVANALWIHQGHPFLPDFLNLATNQYHANLNQADFRADAESARRQINDWVAGQTRDKIKDILPQGALDGMTRLVLVNAIYFKGFWLRQFDSRRTVTSDFHVTAGRTVKVPLMNQTGSFRLGGIDSDQLLELPYQGGDLSMILLLPMDPDGLPRLEASLNAARLQAALASVREHETSVALPRFQLESDFGLDRTLPALGMRDAFTPRADFSGIDGSRQLYISSVRHKAYVEVTEQGTEAAAATATGFRTLGAMRGFRADHPFLFLIRHNPSGAILFLGRVVDPTR